MYITRYLTLIASAAIGCSAHADDIPLSSIYTTSKQDGMQSASVATREASKKPYRAEFAYLQRMLDATGAMGASNAFLAEAPPNISDAVDASSRAFIGEVGADVPVPLNQPDPPRGNFWLLVYLGISGSEEPHWMADGVSVSDHRIRFNYYTRGAETMDVHHYFYWTPLGKLDDGIYSIELYDTKRKAVTLMRRVEILPHRY